MKGERIVAELIALVGMLAYGVLLQHLYSVLMEKPDDSWINQGRLWWVTRRSSARIVRLRKVWESPLSADEPEA